MTNDPPLDRSEGTPPLRVQILATEHWSLLATRGMTWNEIFSRTGTFLTVLSATVIALSLVARQRASGRVFAPSRFWCCRLFSWSDWGRSFAWWRPMSRTRGSWWG
jgi:hypothetical protein